MTYDKPSKKKPLKLRTRHMGIKVERNKKKELLEKEVDMDLLIDSVQEEVDLWPQSLKDNAEAIFVTKRKK